MTETMIERVATIVELALDEVHRKGGAARVDEREWTKRILIAMREPTAAMTADAAEHEAIDGWATWQQVWKAMIDAALAEDA